MNNKPKVLLVGESWMSLGTHVKGFNEFPTGFYEEGHTALSTALSEQFDVEHLPAHLASTRFPESVDELSRYAVVLFSDIGSDTLLLHPDTFIRYTPRPNRLRVVKEYVEAGGGFGMIGGYMSFAGFGGKAHYHATPVEEILPVDILPYDDRVEVPEGFSPEVVDPTHPIVSQVSGAWPVLLGYNRLVPKPEGTVVLQHQSDPILAVRPVGRGRTLAFASDCAPHWGSVEFTEWSQYSVFWNAAVRWLAGNEG
jgi:uncharacterized membrane protein